MLWNAKEARSVEFASPDPAAASPPGSCPLGDRSPRTGLARYASWEPLPSGASLVVLAGRATRGPQAAVTSGMQRTVTSLGTTVALGSGSLTWGGEEAEAAWHARGQREDRPCCADQPAGVTAKHGSKALTPASWSQPVGHVFKVDDSGENP